MVETLDDVLRRLEDIITECREKQSEMGYFPALYYKMTYAVKQGIDRQLFENGNRMERLDVLFARRYFDAYDNWQAGKPVTKAWEIAFQTATNKRATVMQHLLLGINAHINLDLGIAAAQTRPGDAIFGLRADFERINGIIAELTEKVQGQLAHIWLPYRYLDYLLRTEDEGWIDFSIKVARGAAWKVATTLALIQQAETETLFIQNLDEQVGRLGVRVGQPRRKLLRLGLGFMRRGEKGSVPEKIDVLMGI